MRKRRQSARRHAKGAPFTIRRTFGATGRSGVVIGCSKSSMIAPLVRATIGDGAINDNHGGFALIPCSAAHHRTPPLPNLNPLPADSALFEQADQPNRPKARAFLASNFGSGGARRVISLTDRTHGRLAAPPHLNDTQTSPSKRKGPAKRQGP